MKELNPNFEDAHIEAARIAVDAVYVEIGLKFPRDDNNEGLVKPELSTADRPEPPLQILTQTGITEMQGTDNQLDFAYAMVAEAHRQDVDEQFKLVA